MPGFDGTGPMGMGPMTGGGRGLCNPYNPLRTVGFMPPIYGPRLLGPPVPTADPGVPAYAGNMYRLGCFGPGFWPQMMGAVPRFWAGRHGRGRGGGRGRWRSLYYPW